MFGLRPTILEVGYTASSALPAVLGKMVARWHKNRAVPKSACEKTDSGTKTELSHGETAETGGWLRVIMLSDGKTPGRRISQAPKPGLTSMPRSFCGTARFSCWDSPLRVYFSGCTPTATTCIASAGRIALLPPQPCLEGPFEATRRGGGARKRHGRLVLETSDVNLSA